jgi:AmiR/NasT family two-component response regulator
MKRQYPAIDEAIKRYERTQELRHPLPEGLTQIRERIAEEVKQAQELVKQMKRGSPCGQH